MNEKWIGKSMTIWGGIVAALPGVFMALGWDIDIGGIEAAGTAVIQGLSVLIGFVMVVVGRLRANSGTPVTLKPKL